MMHIVTVPGYQSYGCDKIPEIMHIITVPGYHSYACHYA